MNIILPTNVFTKNVNMNLRPHIIIISPRIQAFFSLFAIVFLMKIHSKWKSILSRTAILIVDVLRPNHHQESIPAPWQSARATMFSNLCPIENSTPFASISVNRKPIE